MAERDRSKVTVTLTETQARWLVMDLTPHLAGIASRIIHELKHALAECACGEVGR